MLFNLFAPSYPVVDVNIPEGWWKSDSQLDIDFANNRAFNRKTAYKGRPTDLLTYTSPSPKMIYGADGVLYQSSGTLPIDHDPITHAPLGVLIEEQRTNLLTYSEQFDNAAWTKSRSTVTANTTTAPDGTTTADKLVPNTVDGTHRVYQTGVTHGVDGTKTMTCYLKAGEFLFGSVMISDSSESDRVIAQFNLTDGTISTAVSVGGAGGTFTNPTANISPVGNGWYRCSVTATIAASEATVVGWVWSGNTVSGVSTFAGDDTSGIYLWGAQLEAGAFPTSYIPTVASQVTRAADQVSILTSAFGYSNACTVFAESECFGPTIASCIVYELAATNRADALHQLTYTSVPVLYSTVRSAGFVLEASFSYAGITTSTFYKVATAIEQDNFASSMDGSVAGTDTSGTWPASAITKLAIGGNAIAYLNGHIKRITIWNTRKTNAELQGLTI